MTERYEDQWRERMRWRLTGRWSQRVVEQRLGRVDFEYPDTGLAEVVFGVCFGLLFGLVVFLIVWTVIS